MTQRYGALHAASDALLIGDPGRSHLRLTPDAIAHLDADEEREIFHWTAVCAVRLDVPTTRFRYPGLVGTIGLGVLAALGRVSQ